MTTRTISADTARKAALDECELKIKTAFRRGLEATCSIAKELSKILREELYTLVTNDYQEYVTDYLNIDIRTFRRIVAVSQTIAQLQDAGLALPSNESQAAELARLDAPLRPKVWNDLVLRAEREEKSLTTEDVRRAVEIAVQVAPPAPRSATEADLEIEMDMGGDNGSAPAPRRKAPVVQEAELVLTEKGEAALNRIRKVCGDQIADAIEDGTKALTERDIKNWAEYDDEMMRQLTYLVLDCNYPLTKAAIFLNKAIDGSTDVSDLLLIASSRGGTASINYDNRARITIELTPKA